MQYWAIFWPLASFPYVSGKGLISTQWLKQGPITVQRTGNYYVFTCAHREDVEALIQQSIIDAQITTFHQCH